MTAAAFRATFSDFRIVKGRKMAQIVLETPLEEADAALEVLGGVPRPDAERWVAVARLETQPAKVEKPKGPTASQRAWALCNTRSFKSWIDDDFGADRGQMDEEQCADILRKRLGITSRGELDTNPEARARFETLEREYQEAMR
jgi:hypothetical protein